MSLLNKIYVPVNPTPHYGPVMRVLHRKTAPPTSVRRHPLERPLERRPTLLFGAPCLLPPQADAYALPEYNHSMSRLL